jgi:hypothetical protein
MTKRAARKQAELNEVLEEVAANRREIAATRPLVDEAIKRTNDSFIAVENKTMRVILGGLLGLSDREAP